MLSEIAARFEIHPNRVSLWKRDAVGGRTYRITGSNHGGGMKPTPDPHLQPITPPSEEWGHIGLQCL